MLSQLGGPAAAALPDILSSFPAAGSLLASVPGSAYSRSEAASLPGSDSDRESSFPGSARSARLVGGARKRASRKRRRSPSNRSEDSEDSDATKEGEGLYLEVVLAKNRGALKTDLAGCELACC